MQPDSGKAKSCLDLTPDPKYIHKDVPGDCMWWQKQGAEYHCCCRKLYEQPQV